MKKYIVGMVFGIFLSLSTSVYAEEIKTLIGRAIEGEFPVHINGRTLTNKAIVIDGTSYLPVREFGEAVGYDVKFDADLGISLEKKLTVTGEKMSGEYKVPEWAGTVIIHPPSDPIVQDNPPSQTESELALDEIERLIDSQKSNIATQEWVVSMLKENGGESEKLQLLEQQLQEAKDRLAELEAQKAELSK
jgi:hypothetical protein